MKDSKPSNIKYARRAQLVRVVGTNPMGPGAAHQRTSPFEVSLFRRRRKNEETRTESACYHG